MLLHSMSASRRSTQNRQCAPVNEDSLQTGVDEVRHQRTVVSADSLNAFAVHFVMCVCTGGEIKTCVSLLVD